MSLNAQGYNVLATDVPSIAEGLLRTNLAARPPPTTELQQPSLQAKALDWFAEPSTWDFERSSVTPRESDTPAPSTLDPTLRPPFDLITTTDSIYHPSLSQPLLRTLHALSTSPHSVSRSTGPPIFVALEVRDPQLIDGFLESARIDWGFKCSRVENGRLEKLMGEGGVGWEGEDWEGVQVWKLVWKETARGKQ